MLYDFLLVPLLVLAYMGLETEVDEYEGGV
jgi:hypothetical protein